MQRAGNRLQVSVAQSHDPRVIGFVAGVMSGGRWARLCRGIWSCRGTLPAGADVSKVGVVNMDVWHRPSSAAFSTAVRQP